VAVPEDLVLVRGTLDMLVLKALAWGPQHGYAVTAWIRETTREELKVEDAALYASLHRLAARHWVEAEWGESENGRKAKYYSLTAAGRSQLRAQSATWARYARAVGRVLGTV
jgi:PadR family transcriptional regulator PadR